MLVIYIRTEQLSSGLFPGEIALLKNCDRVSLFGKRFRSDLPPANDKRTRHCRERTSTRHAKPYEIREPSPPKSDQPTAHKSEATWRQLLGVRCKFDKLHRFVPTDAQ